MENQYVLVKDTWNCLINHLWVLADKTASHKKCFITTVGWKTVESSPPDEKLSPQTTIKISSATHVCRNNDSVSVQSAFGKTIHTCGSGTHSGLGGNLTNLLWNDQINPLSLQLLRSLHLRVCVWADVNVSTGQWKQAHTPRQTGQAYSLSAFVWLNTYWSVFSAETKDGNKQTPLLFNENSIFRAGFCRAAI